MNEQILNKIIYSAKPIIEEDCVAYRAELNINGERIGAEIRIRNQDKYDQEFVEQELMCMINKRIKENE